MADLFTELKKEVKKDLTHDREKIIQELCKKKWFQNTSKKLQFELMSLPQEGRENHDGFLKDLAERSEEVGGIRIIKLEELPRGNYALLPRFLVQKIDDPSFTYTYEYASWRYGPSAGAKGLVLVEKNGKLTHFIVLRADKFSTGKTVYDVTGGFADINVGGVRSIIERFIVELNEELGTENLKIKEVIPLGRILPDAGMTNNNPEMYAAIISGSELENIKTESPNLDKTELTTRSLILPMSYMREFIGKNDDAFFLSAVARLIALGTIQLDN